MLALKYMGIVSLLNWPPFLASDTLYIVFLKFTNVDILKLYNSIQVDFYNFNTHKSASMLYYGLLLIHQGTRK